MARPSSSTRCAEPRPPTASQARGAAAEAAAARFLQARAFTILTRNYRCRMGELDLVAIAPDGTLVITEVRLRTRQNYGGAAASVDFRKQQRLVRATRHLLATQPRLAQCALRFDVMDVRPAPDGHDIHWIQHAFTAA